MDMPLFLYGMVLIRVGGVELKQRQSLLEMESLPHHILHRIKAWYLARHCTRESKFTHAS